MKGNKMKQLENLQKKVLQVIRKNKELADETELLKMENEQLKEKCQQLESSLISASHGSQELAKEKSCIKDSIEELIESIGSLDDIIDKEITKS